MQTRLTLTNTHLPTASTALASAAPIRRIFSPSALALSTVFVLNTEVSWFSHSETGAAVQRIKVCRNTVSLAQNIPSKEIQRNNVTAS